jgi:hypothetical protein
MLRGAYEAVYQGTPVIVSDWPLLREAFNRGAIHVDNTTRGIAEGVREMRDRHRHYKSEVLTLREHKRAMWEQSKSSLLARLGAARTQETATVADV